MLCYIVNQGIKKIMSELNLQSIPMKDNFVDRKKKLTANIALTQNCNSNPHFPKISNFQSDSYHQLTLHSIIKRLQQFILQSGQTLPPIFFECLQTLKHSRKQNIKLPKISVLQQLQSNPSNNSLKFLSKKKDDIFGRESQVMNVKREYLKKVDSRDLFQKMRTIKYEQNQPGQVQARELKITNSLKAKIVDQDKVIKVLQETIQKQKLHIENLKLTVRTMMKNDRSVEQKMGYVQKLKELNDQISNLQIIIKQKEEEIANGNQRQQQRDKAAVNNYAKLKQVIKQRESELISIWQVCQADSRMRFL